MQIGNKRRPEEDLQSIVSQLCNENFEEEMVKKETKKWQKYVSLKIKFSLKISWNMS